MDLYAFFQSEVKPTIGCTEPGAVAYAAAVAARHLPTQPVRNQRFVFGVPDREVPMLTSPKARPR